jgi:hypothetical protein
MKKERRIMSPNGRRESDFFDKELCIQRGIS